MTSSVKARIQRRIEQLDDWDDGEGFTLDSEAGAKIVSYTGVHGWQGSAGHEPPSIEPVLRQVMEEVEQLVARVGVRPSRDAALESCRRSFMSRPNLSNLLGYALLADKLFDLPWDEFDALSAPSELENDDDDI